MDAKEHTLVCGPHGWHCPLCEAECVGRERERALYAVAVTPCPCRETTPPVSPCPNCSPQVRA